MVSSRTQDPRAHMSRGKPLAVAPMALLSSRSPEEPRRHDSRGDPVGGCPADGGVSRTTESGLPSAYFVRSASLRSSLRHDDCSFDRLPALAFVRAGSLTKGRRS